jgi:hypothetical protein
MLIQRQASASEMEVTYYSDGDYTQWTASPGPSGPSGGVVVSAGWSWALTGNDIPSVRQSSPYGTSWFFQAVTPGDHTADITLTLTCYIETEGAGLPFS